MNEVLTIVKVDISSGKPIGTNTFVNQQAFATWAKPILHHFVDYMFNMVKHGDYIKADDNTYWYFFWNVIIGKEAVNER